MSGRFCGTPLAYDATSVTRPKTGTCTWVSSPASFADARCTARVRSATASEEAAQEEAAARERWRARTCSGSQSRSAALQALACCTSTAPAWPQGRDARRTARTGGNTPRPRPRRGCCSHPARKQGTHPRARRTDRRRARRPMRSGPSPILVRPAPEVAAAHPRSTTRRRCASRHIARGERPGGRASSSRARLYLDPAHKKKKGPLAGPRLRSGGEARRRARLRSLAQLITA